MCAIFFYKRDPVQKPYTMNALNVEFLHMLYQIFIIHVFPPLKYVTNISCSRLFFFPQIIINLYISYNRIMNIKIFLCMYVCMYVCYSINWDAHNNDQYVGRPLIILRCSYKVWEVLRRLFKGWALDMKLWRL